MDYKAVLQEQIRELQNLQDKNIRSDGPLGLKIDNAIKLADQIKKIVEVRE
ncbi:MAG TPA: hypothetical protein VFC58_01380 [Desulfosporosinus sp.]|nr:hypothetical protein [Desulfosporosinus sp.]